MVRHEASLTRPSDTIYANVTDTIAMIVIIQILSLSKCKPRELIL